MNAEHLGRLVAIAIAGTFTAVTARYSSFAATISDGSGYVSEATRWLEADLFVPQPFAFWPDWPLSWSVPLAYRTGPLAGADVFTYPPGLPMTMAAAMASGGELAAYLIPPVLGGLLVWASGDLAARLAGPIARVIASALMATSAIALLMAVQPMSDVPASAWWALALVFSLRGRGVATLAAGLTVSMAILTRPNLAPLALVPGVLVMFAAPPARRIFFGSLFGCAAVVGPLLLMWLQQILYGSPWTPGHSGVYEMFSWSNVSSNLLGFPRWYAEAHTNLAALAMLAPVAFWRARAPTAHTERLSQRSLVIGLMVVVFGVYVAYLPYVQWTEWSFVRFMLPALGPLYALTAAVLVHGVRRLPRVAQTPVLVLVTLASVGGQASEAYARGVTGSWNETAGS
jgi:4-amino-4-deoxy-L-arabinose transferase-like glycosyltransferase